MNQRAARFVAARNALLTAVGWIALLLYILACRPSRPSWSPDGSKLLVSYYDPNTDEADVVVFDRTTGATRTVFVRPNPSDEEHLIASQWHNDGEHSIVWYEEHGLLVLPTDSSAPMRLFDLPEEVEWAPFPIPQIGEDLYFSGDAVVKVDLATGETTSHETNREFLLYAGGNRVFYLAETDDGYEFGEVDQEELAFEPLFRLDDDDLERRGINDLVGYYIAFEPHGRRLALTGRSEHGTRIILCTEAGIDRVLTPQLSAETFVLGNIEWSPTRDILYAAAFTPTDLADVTQVSVAEIRVDGASAPLIPLLEMQAGLPDDDDAWDGLIQIALSPDGSRIAASTAHFGDDSLYEEDPAVFLVELEGTERTVTKFPLSSWER